MNHHDCKDRPTGPEMYFYYRTGMHGLMKPTPAKNLHIDYYHDYGPPV